MMKARRSKKLIPALLCVITAAVTLLVQTAFEGTVDIAGVSPALLAVCAAVGSVYLGGVGGALMGGLCGLLMDALIPGVRFWVYTAVLAVACGAVGSISSYTYKYRIITSLIWSAAVLIVVGLAETLVFGVIRGCGVGECIRAAAIQAAYSLVFAVPYDFIFRAVARRIENT